MDASAPPEKPSTEMVNEWSTTALRLAIELGKDLLTVQAQRQQALEQRASVALPISASLLVALASALFGGQFKPEGGTLVYLLSMVGSLVVGVILSLLTLIRARPNDFAGMEPRDALAHFASGDGERGTLKAVYDEYQRRITTNREQIRWLSIGATFAIMFAALGVTYGALTVFQHRYGEVLAAGARAPGPAAHTPAPNP